MQYKVVGSLKFFKDGGKDYYLYLLRSEKGRYMVEGSSEYVFEMMMGKDYDLHDTIDTDMELPMFCEDVVFDRLRNLFVEA